jgi:hypothetical protein
MFCRYVAIVEPSDYAKATYSLGNPITLALQIYIQRPERKV